MTDPTSRPEAPRPQDSPPTPTSTAAAEMRHDSVSVRAVLAALQAGHRMTGAALREASGLPRRTVYEALRTLRKRGIVLARQSLHDSRQTYFWLAESAGARPDLHAFGRSGSGEPAVPAH